MKFLIEKLASRSKQSEFRFDENLSNLALLELLFDKSLQMLRAMPLVFRFKSPILIFVGRRVKFRSLDKIALGKWVSIGDYSFVSGLGKGKLKIGSGVSIGSHCRIFTSVNYRDLGEFVSLEENVGIGDYSCVAGSGGVRIGVGTITGPYFSVHPENHKFDGVESEIRAQGTVRNKIDIGANCWIGAKVTVLSGVTIGNNCVIGAGSVVTKSIPSNSVAVGVPAKVVRSRV